MEVIQTILHPTDFSHHSQYALGLACGLARDHGARLIILHVVPREGPIAVVKDQLERLALPGLPVRAQRILKQGAPATEILQTAREASCDLIVMGTHGWTGETRNLVGSVAEEVAQNAACPVVTVKTPLAVQARTGMETSAEEVSVIL